MEFWIWVSSSLAILIHFGIFLSIAFRVIMIRPANGVALAWLLLVASAPFAGAAIYLLIGERRIGWRRFEGILTIRSDMTRIFNAANTQSLTAVDWSIHPPACRAVDQVGQRLCGLPTVCGSSYELYDDTADVLQLIARDIDQAKTNVLMEFYIWHEGGLADQVTEALIRAAGRGVYCLVLVDDLGAAAWWKGKQPRRLREAGVHLRSALPVGLVRTLIGRNDLRLHRKIVVIDNQIAWTGSMNLVDPRFFKQDAGVGQWVDAMVRLKGAVITPLAAVIVGDWALETNGRVEDEMRKARIELSEATGKADIQVVPSGPGESGDALLQMLLALINSAQREVIMTTPYLVPDDSLLRAIRGAAARGVKTSLVVPEKVDSLLTRYASRSYFDDLLTAGVHIYLYRDGLLHTKSITVDNYMSMFGTVNLDMRSIWLNYEVALFLYNEEFTSELSRLQQAYMRDSDAVEISEWQKRRLSQRVLENAFRLISPLL